ncbi:MAG: Uma2 family endonuclease [Acidobacteria bacterium]|nr:Uma2 family endonuclease [Acidobacteriota bacterium]MBI3426269.1 Uma2 family endonuclease [Acidobacteriota bacterium]
MVAEYLPVPRMKHSLEEYYAMLEASDRRWEFWNGEFVCMSGGSPAHAMICNRVSYALNKRLAGGGCEVFGSDMAIKTPSLPPFRYPDLSVVCGKPVFGKVDKFHVLVNPLVLIEVLSTGTEHLDREPKRLAYQAIPSVQEYLLIAQNIPHVTRFVRKGRRWQRFEYGSLTAVVELSSLECELPLSEVYRGIEFK